MNSSSSVGARTAAGQRPAGDPADLRHRYRPGGANVSRIHPVSQTHGKQFYRRAEQRVFTRRGGVGGPGADTGSLADREEGAERDDLSEFWSRESQAYPLDEGGWLQGKLEDLQGRFHLNGLDTPPAQGQRFSAAQEQFIRLLQTFSELEVSQQDAMLITTAVLDWMDGDTQPRDLGAEDLYYFDATPPYRAANRRFASVSELRAVANMSPDLYLALEPFLTVWPDTGERLKLNVNTAPAQVLRSLNSAGDYQPLSEVEGEMLLELRGENGFESMEVF